VPVPIALSSVAAFAVEVTAARSVDFASYTLHGGRVREALSAAARAGAHVRVRLEREPLDDPKGSLRAANGESVARLAEAGADAALTAPGAPVLHLKAALVDGVAWLDDRNWDGGARETVVRDSDQADLAALREALDGTGTDGGTSLQTTKGAAAAGEAAVIRAAGAGPVAVASESFGVGPVYGALLARGREGSPTRLLVAGREASATGTAGDAERRLLSRLASLGIAVRIGNPPAAECDEKLAVAPDAAWVGSANATYAGGTAGAQSDWGIAARDPLLVDGLRAVFEANWSRAIEGKLEKLSVPSEASASPSTLGRAHLLH
jgi:hypothetical protein